MVDILIRLPRPDRPDIPAVAERSRSALYAWGAIIFGAGAMPVRQIRRRREYRWAEQEVIGRWDAGAHDDLQFTGRDIETLEMTGVTFPGQAGDMEMVSRIAAAADAAEIHALVSRRGASLGRCSIEGIEEVHESLLADGTPGRIAWKLRFVRHPGPEPAARLDDLEVRSR